MNKKTIAIFTAFYLPHLGGVENYVANMSRELSELGFKVVIVTSAHKNECGIENKDGASIFRLPSYILMNDRLPLLKKNSAFMKLKKELFSIKFDYVFVNTRYYQISLLGLKLAKSQGIPAMVLEHGSSYLILNNAIFDLMIRFYEHFMTMLIKKYHPKFYAVSNKSGSWLGTFGITCEGVLSNAVNEKDLSTCDSGRDFRKEFSIGDSDIVVAFTGRMLKEKGILKLAEAFEGINEFTQRQEAYLCMAGDGPDLPALSEFKSDRVILLGRLSKGDISALLDQSDIFCFPTDYPEGFPTSVLEAAVKGLGIIISDTGGSDELIPNDDYGIILSDTSVTSIKEALWRYFDDPDYLERSGSKIRRRTQEQFNWEKTASDFIRVVNGEL